MNGMEVGGDPWPPKKAKSALGPAVGSRAEVEEEEEGSGGEGEVKEQR